MVQDEPGEACAAPAFVQGFGYLASIDLEETAAQISGPLPQEEPTASRGGVSFEALVSRDDFLAGVERIRNDIRNGEIIQAVLSQPFKASISASPFSIYRSLRAINPSPYLFFLDFGDFALVGSSPEVMVRLDGREIMTKPIDRSPS